MDYRNADGSLAEMCGNGIRVFLHVLRHRGAAGPGGVRGRRAGRHPRRPAAGRRDARTAATGSTWAPRGRSARARRRVAGRAFPGLGGVDGQPAPGLPHRRRRRHPGPDRAPGCRPGAVPRRASTSSWSTCSAERRGARTSGCGSTSAGVGETRSCGTGACAAAYAALAASGRTAGTVVGGRPRAAGCRCEVDAADDGAHRPGRRRLRRRPLRGVAPAEPQGCAAGSPSAASSVGGGVLAVPASGCRGRCPGRRRRRGCAAG